MIAVVGVTASLNCVTDIVVPRNALVLVDKLVGKIENTLVLFAMEGTDWFIMLEEFPIFAILVVWVIWREVKVLVVQDGRTTKLEDAVMLEAFVTWHLFRRRTKTA